MSEAFDSVADDYDAQLQKGLSLTGESKEYFADGRMRWVRRRLDKLGESPRTALDFGCGTGSATPFFFEHLRIEKLFGSDVSRESLNVATKQFGGEFEVEFGDAEDVPAGEIEFAFCNGVFHHIGPEDRSEALRLVHRTLRPGGIFAFWENNPWNPGTRWAMSRVPFDADAIMIWPGEARRLLRAAGFKILATDFLFYFPAALSFLRFTEPVFRKVPFGGQYLVLCRKEVEG